MRLDNYKKLNVTATIPFLLAVVLAGCSGGSQPDGKIVAKVGDTAISQRAFDNYLTLKRIPADDERRVEQALNDYLQREALALQMVDSKYIDPAQLQAEINEFRKQMVISRYFERYLEEKVTEEAIRNYYNTHQEDYQIEQAKVAHILVRTHDKMSEQERSARLMKAQEAYSKAQTGASFEALAEEYSEDTISAKQGGMVGWVKRGAIAQSFSEKVFSMKAGEISEPFATPFGFHVVKLVEAAQVVKTPYEKVKGDIRYRLRQEAKQAETERLQSALKVERK